MAKNLSVAVVPRASVWSYRCGPSGMNCGHRSARPCLVEPGLEFGDLRRSAFELARAEIIDEQVEADLVIDRFAKRSLIRPRLDLMRDLLRSECQQHAEDHHADLAEKGAPAVQRLQDFEIH